MQKIESFEVNHLKLLPGVYVSRKDEVAGNVLTTFDIRMTQPNEEPVMDTASIHTIEHLGATFLRNHNEYAEQVIYFGPMGCRTGFYLILAGNFQSKDIVDLLIDMYHYIVKFKGDIPGATPEECGNYSDQDLETAKVRSKKYLDILKDIEEDRLIYSE